MAIIFDGRGRAVDALEAPDTTVGLAVTLIGYPSPIDVTPGLRTTSSGFSEDLVASSGVSYWPWAWTDCDGYESLHITGLSAVAAHLFFVRVYWDAGLPIGKQPADLYMYDGATEDPDGRTRANANRISLSIPVRGTKFRVEFKQSSGTDVTWHLQYHLRT